MTLQVILFQLVAVDGRDWETHLGDFFGKMRLPAGAGGQGPAGAGGLYFNVKLPEPQP
jgi:hypothetical protein